MFRTTLLNNYFCEVKAEIINIGDEILIGQIVNTNASWMAEQLTNASIEVAQITVISDKKKEIFNALDEALKKVDIILLTGGLGPTKDDITKQTLVEYFKSELIFNEEAYQQIKELFDLRAYKITEINRNQAEIPKNCIPLKNSNGTAPGMWFEWEGKVIVSMPGVPFEMKDLMKEQVIPRLQKKFKFQSIYKRTILTQGIGESHLADIINDWESSLPDNFKLAYLPQPGIVRLRLSAYGIESDTFRKTFENQIKKLNTLIPELIFGYEDDRLEEIVGSLLRKRKFSLSTAESCTGGYIAHLITDIPGSSDYFKGSVIAYSNEIKEHILDVRSETIANHGAVSKQTVCEMALGIQRLYQTDYAIATSGIAGPGGGTTEKVVGTTWIAIALPDKTVIAKKYLFGEHRGRNIRKTALTALNLLRKSLIKAEVI